MRAIRDPAEREGVILAASSRTYTEQRLREESPFPGAPLRNRTVDLLLTMDAGFVRRSRGPSGCRRQEGYRRLGPSRFVCCCLDPLSLDLSLARIAVV